MLLPRPVTALAIDAFGQWQQIPGLGALLAVGRRDLRVGVVARHALVGDGSGGTGMVRPIIPRIGRPGASVFRIPSERQLLQRAAAGQAQIGARMITRPQHEIALLLLAARWIAAE